MIVADYDINGLIVSNIYIYSIPAFRTATRLCGDYYYFNKMYKYKARIDYSNCIPLVDENGKLIFYNEELTEKQRCNKERYQESRVYHRTYRREYQKMKKGKAVRMAGTHRASDYKRGMDVSNNIDYKWIMEHIFNGQTCFYCGESDWRKLGCDRINNKLPHTPDNIVCACGKCNTNRGNKYSVEEYFNMKHNINQLSFIF